MLARNACGNLCLFSCPVLKWVKFRKGGGFKIGYFLCLKRGGRINGKIFVPLKSQLCIWAMVGVQRFCNLWAILVRNDNQHLFAFLCLALSLVCLCIQARGRIHGLNNWRQPHPCKDILGQSIFYCTFIFVLFPVFCLCL